LLLDRTIFYPAGGGQPADGGELRSGAAVFTLRDVRLKDGVVRHTGVVAPPDAAAAFAAGADVALRVDGAKRELHARIHSAGHLLDVCMARCGYPPATLVPTKGLHGPAEATAWPPAVRCRLIARRGPCLVSDAA
jgi:Ser-tRNA(Ala) deacylase AlaX